MKIQKMKYQNMKVKKIIYQLKEMHFHDLKIEILKNNIKKIYRKMKYQKK